MAINVYMTLFRSYNAQQLKNLEKYYIMCYAIPFVVALVYIFIDTPARGKIYGPATVRNDSLYYYGMRVTDYVVQLWCWIDIQWVVFRVILCYAPAWCSILIAFSIYVLAGREIFKKRKQLRAFSNPTRPVIVELENPFTAFKTTEIQITSELATLDFSSPDMSNAFLAPESEKAHFGTTNKPINSRSPSTTSKAYDRYSVKIHSAPMSPRFEVPPTPSRGASKTQIRNNRAAMEANTAAWG